MASQNPNLSGLTIALIILCAVGFLTLYFKTSLEATLNAGALATVSRQVVRVESRLAADEKAANPAMPDATATKLSSITWMGLGFKINQSEWNTLPWIDDSHLAYQPVNGLGGISIIKEPLMKVVASGLQKTPYTNLVFKPAGVCDVYYIKSMDTCSAAFYFTTSKNVFKIETAFSSPLSSIQDLDDPTGKIFFSSLTESKIYAQDDITPATLAAEAASEEQRFKALEQLIVAKQPKAIYKIERTDLGPMLLTVSSDPGNLYINYGAPGGPSPKDNTGFAIYISDANGNESDLGKAVPTKYPAVTERPDHMAAPGDYGEYSAKNNGNLYQISVITGDGTHPSQLVLSKVLDSVFSVFNGK